MSITINHQTNDISASSGSMTIDGSAVGGGGGGVTGFTSADNTASPNNTVNVASLAVNSSSTNAGAAIIPKGTGAFMLGIPDSGTTGGNVRGASAIDLGIYRTNANQVASGGDSIVIGNRMRASGTEAIASGKNSVASGYRAMAVGYDSNAVSGGTGARYFGIGAQTQYRVDTVTIAMRIVSVSTGEVLLSVTTQKDIASHASGVDVFKFLDLGTKALEIESGVAINEPVNYAVRAAVEQSIVEIVEQGERRELWKYKFPDTQERVNNETMGNNDRIVDGNTN